MCRTSSCMRMISNQMPSEARAAASCWDSRMRCSSLIRFHIGVSYSDTSSGGQNHLPSSKGASQSSSLSGSKECLAEEARSRSATCSRSLSSPSASRSPSRASVSDRVVMAAPPRAHLGYRRVTTYETACQQARQSLRRDLLPAGLSGVGSTGRRMVTRWSAPTAIGLGTLMASVRLRYMGAIMSAARDYGLDDDYEWPRPPAGGWTADDLDELPNLPPHTELIDGNLVFVSPQTTFHMRAIRLLDHALFEQAPEEFEVYREFTVTLNDRNRPEPDVLIARAGADTGPKRTRL